MQPEPHASSTQDPERTTPTPTHSTSQHGLHEHGTPAAESAAKPSAEGTSDEQEQVLADAALAARLEVRDASNTPSQTAGGLSGESTPPLTPATGRNRISEYENASTPPLRKNAGPQFEVIQKTRSPSDKRSPIQELPNEVLTHTFARLSPSDLTSVSLVSKRFHGLVTGPHAWRSAFAHYFPGPDSINLSVLADDSDSEDGIRSGRRAFTRLTALASWRSEYIVRTRLLRSLARRKPVQAIASPSAARSGQAHVARPTIAYSTMLFTTINHLHATFGTGLNKRSPRVIHGGDDQGIATCSDPSTSKVDQWGLSDPLTFWQFAERFPGDAQYGLGPGDVVGVPNVMDVSQPYGMIHGEGSPKGSIYFRSTEEMRGRFLLLSSSVSAPEDGVPRMSLDREAITSVWIAKNASTPALTDGSVGMLVGTSLGTLTAYSLGMTNQGSPRDQRFNRGQITARWNLSPGVPLIAIAVDNEYSMNRYAQNRIWAVVLNALGEIFYLTKFPKVPSNGHHGKLDDEATERVAWATGRSVYWNLVEPSRRKARPDPYGDSAIDGSYSPRTSWNGMCLSKQQVQAETREIEAFAARKPKDFQKSCLGWDMRRRLEVDFAGDDGNNAGESVLVIECGLEEGSTAAVTRFTRCRFRERHSDISPSTPPLTSASTHGSESPSVFGGGVPASPPSAPPPDFTFDSLEESLSQDDFGGTVTPKPMREEWRTTTLSLGGLRNIQILATTIDNSTFATQTISEDPLLSLSARSNTSSPTLTPLPLDDKAANPDDVPGQRARLFAVGTATGSILLWNIRAAIPRLSHSDNTIEPARIIYTSSPQISCLAMSSLYLVHGGNDGLVQAWDPLASDLQPIVTLSSRFSSRARRRLVQAQASPQGVGINLFAAGALCLDPDPTVLRGMVSLGTQLLYWSFSSSAADQYKSQKRRLRHSERGSNHGAERFSASTRGNLKDYIAAERFEMDREKQQMRKESARFANRFGTTLMDGSEEEMLAYAAMLSQESLEQETLRRASDTSSTVVSSVDHSAFATGAAATPTTGSVSPRHSTPKTEDEFDADVAEAIRQSLSTSPPTSSNMGFDIPIRRAKPKARKGSSARPSPRPSPLLAGSSQNKEMTDLDFALQLSLAEEQSRQDTASTGGSGEGTFEEFPALGPKRTGGGTGGKGKERAA